MTDHIMTRPPPHISVALVHHRHGINVYAGVTEQECVHALAQYCREFWKDAVEADGTLAAQPSSDDQSTVDAYFATLEGEYADLETIELAGAATVIPAVPVQPESSWQGNLRRARKALLDAGENLLACAHDTSASDAQREQARDAAGTVVCATTCVETLRSTKTPRSVTGAVTTMAVICEVVARRYGLTVEALRGHTREQPAVRARQVAMRLCREMTDRSYPAIGRFFNRDHSTVMHACAVTDGMCLADLRAAIAASGSQPR